MASTIVLCEMLYELQTNHLEVILVPQDDPANVGACNRLAVGFNCEWYRQLCDDYESHRRRKYKKFKTRIKRKHIEFVLQKMIAGVPVQSKYCKWITDYADKLENEYFMQGKE